jgi:hypothetical protein
MNPLMIGLRLVHFIADVAWVGGAVVLQLASGSRLALDGSSTKLRGAFHAFGLALHEAVQLAGPRQLAGLRYPAGDPEDRAING